MLELSILISSALYYTIDIFSDMPSSHSEEIVSPTVVSGILSATPSLLKVKRIDNHFDKTEGSD